MKKKYKRRILIVAALVILQITYTGKETAAQAPEELTVTSEVMVGSSKGYTPDEIYEQRDLLYRLKSWEIERVMIPPRTEEVEQEVRYESVEQKSPIQELYSVISKDRISGTDITKKYPVRKQKKTGERWTDDFSVPVIFHSYGADYYQIGEQKVPLQAEQPQFEGYKKQLLSEIQVSADNYEITDIIWDGAPYLDNDNILCRNAVASGRKKVTDYLVTYGGMVTFPEVEGFQCRAVYSLKVYEHPQAEDRIIVSETIIADAVEEQAPSWLIMRQAIGITVSILLVALVILLLIWLTKRIWKFSTKRKKRGEDAEHTNQNTELRKGE